MGIILGGPKAYKVFRKGEICVALHWVNGDPAMCIFPLRKRLGGAGFILPLPVAHCYAKADGYPTPEAVARCVKAAQVMGMEPTKDTVSNILTAILDLMPELVSMPPEPPAAQAKGRPVGEVTLYEGSRKVAETEISAPLMLPAGLH